MNKHDDLASSLCFPVRSAVIGATPDMLVFGNYNKALNRGRNEVISIMAKKLNGFKGKGDTGKTKVRKIRDRGDEEEAPTTFGGYVQALAKKTPNAAKDSLVPMDERVRLTKVPNKPAPGQPPTIWAAKKEGEVEVHLLRGVTDSREMAQLIKLPERKAREFMERVKARWSIAGSAYDIKKGRGEALAYLGKMKRSLWEIVESKESIGSDGKKVKGKHEGGFTYKGETRVYSLSLLTRLFGSQLMLEGVTQDAIEDLSRAADESGEVMQRMKKQRSVSMIAGRLLDLVQTIRERDGGKAKTRIVDGETGEVEDDDDDE